MLDLLSLTTLKLASKKDFTKYELGATMHDPVSPSVHLMQEDAVEAVVAVMEEYNLSQDDYDTIMEISKFGVRTRWMCSLLCNVTC